MSRSDAAGFGLTAATVTAIGVLGLMLRTPDFAKSTRPPPLFDPAVAGARPDVLDAASQARIERATEADAEFGALRPLWSEGLVIHLAAEGDAPEPNGESPYHLVIRRGGVVEATVRLKRGDRGGPSGGGFAARALHVLVPAALATDEPRDLAVRQLFGAAARAFGGADAVRFSFELPGSDADPPAGIDIARFTPLAIEMKRP